MTQRVCTRILAMIQLVQRLDGRVTDIEVHRSQNAVRSSSLASVGLVRFANMECNDKRSQTSSTIQLQQLTITMMSF